MYDFVTFVEGLLLTSSDCRVCFAISVATRRANELQKRYPDRHFEHKVALQDNIYAMGIRRGDFDFLRWVNTSIFIHSHDGQISKLYEKWMGEPLKDLLSF